MSKLAPYAKAVRAFLGTVVGALSVAVVSAQPHTLAAIDTLGWLAIAATVLGVTGTVYGATNKTDALGTAVTQYREARDSLEAIAGLIAATRTASPPAPVVVPAPAPVVVPEGPVQVITPSVEVPVPPAT